MDKQKKCDKITQELRFLYEKNGGNLNPVTVVEAAKNPKSALHNKFEWNNTKAAHEYRLWQARQLIRVSIEYLEDGKEVPTRVFVSLKSDRTNNIGYRSMVDVMSDKQMRSELLSDALDELERIKLKYARLRELSEVFSAIARARKKAV